MFSTDEIHEVMAEEIGEFQIGAKQMGAGIVTATGRVLGNPFTPFLRRKQESRRFWPESETYPSVRHGFLTGETKADRYGEGK